MGQPHDKYKRKLKELEVKIIKSNHVDINFPHPNKIRMLEKDLGYDLYVLLDHDTVVCKDFSKFLQKTAVKAKPEDGSFNVRWDTWNELYDLFNINLPSLRYISTVDGGIMLPYFNSGVLIVPGNYRKNLYKSWFYCVKQLLAKKEEINFNTYFIDQIALPLALQRENIEIIPLPIEMNCHTHEPINDIFRPQTIEPYIIHYHHRIDHLGYVQASDYPRIQNKIAEFNDLLKEHRQNKFDNQLFWDYRYAKYPQLGSGAGSRGKELNYKKEILDQAIEKINPESILDVGCGDQFVADELPDDKYTGLDLSSVIISKNKRKYPERKFIEGDFLKKEFSSFEMTICFDVIIHLNNADDYRNFVEKLVAVTGKGGVIAGFEEKPQIYCSELTFYHEPLSLTLKNSGAKDLKLLGEYREMAIWYFTVEENKY